MSQRAKTIAVAQDARKNAFRLIGLQALFATVIVVSWAVVSSHTAYSALAGALACILPNLYFARRFFASVVLLDPKKILRNFYFSELIKLLLSAVLIAVSFSTLQLSVLGFFTGFMGAHLGFWMAPLLVNNKVLAR